MHGVIDVLSADFDIDGDLDLLAVSAFPDPRIRPYESAILFEQIRSLEFAPLAIAEAGGSRWVAAAGVDMEGDGDLDIVLAGANTSTTRADRRWSTLAGRIRESWCFSATRQSMPMVVTDEARPNAIPPLTRFNDNAELGRDWIPS